MPYKSDSQRRWAHTENGEKALGGPEAVNEWDQASKGKDLPEKVKKMSGGGMVGDCYSEGGIVDPTSESVTDQPDEFNRGIQDGINGDLNQWKQKLQQVEDVLMSKFGKGDPRFGSTLGTDTTGLQGLANQKAGIMPSTSNMQGFADGGVVQDPQFDPNAGLPSVPTTPMQTASPMPSTPTQMPIEAPNPMSNYINAQKANINKYGPEQQLAVQNAIIQRQKSPGSLVGQGLAGLGDAIMQGVARTGNPGFLANVQGQQDKQAQMQLQGLKEARGANIQNIEQGQRLDAMDPKSPLSESKRMQNGPILSAMGFDPSTIDKMSAAEMDTTLQILKDFRGKELETAVGRMKASIEAKAQAETAAQHTKENALKAQAQAEEARKNQMAEELKGKEIGAGMLEKAATVPVMSRVASLLGGNPAQAALQKEALGKGPLGDRTVKNGKTYEWSPISKMYHPIGE